VARSRLWRGSTGRPTGNIGGITIPAGRLRQSAHFAWNLVSPNGGGTVTQVAGPSATSSTHARRFLSSGTLVSYIIQSDGTIQGTFSNGQTSALGQIALASFTNEQGLIAMVKTNFREFVFGPSERRRSRHGRPWHTFRRALEQSNVDIATQFAQLIVAERSTRPTRNRNDVRRGHASDAESQAVIHCGSN